MARRIRQLTQPPAGINDLQAEYKWQKYRRLVVATVTLTWTFPANRTDTIPIAATEELTASLYLNDQLLGQVKGAPGTVGSFETGVMHPGVYYVFSGTITDSGNRQSGGSNQINVSIELAPPAAITDLHAVVNY